MSTVVNAPSAPQRPTSHVVSEPSVERGADVARDLGWPKDRMGLSGAFAGLLDVGAPYWQRRHAATRMSRREAELTMRVRVHMLRHVKRLTAK
ncbi:MAG: hypothetical protein WKF96_22910 [Solirubrobacteraceae bacterium]